MKNYMKSVDSGSSSLVCLVGDLIFLVSKALFLLFFLDGCEFQVLQEFLFQLVLDFYMNESMIVPNF